MPETLQEKLKEAILREKQEEQFINDAIESFIINRDVFIETFMGSFFRQADILAEQKEDSFYLDIPRSVCIMGYSHNGKIDVKSKMSDAHVSDGTYLVSPYLALKIQKKGKEGTIITLSNTGSGTIRVNADWSRTT